MGLGLGPSVTTTLRELVDRSGCLQTEDRRPKTEDRRPKTEDRRPKTEDRRFGNQLNEMC